jgi:hypothetical protein
MFRIFVVAFVVSCFAPSASAQAQPAPAAATTQTGTSTTKPAVKKPAKAKAAAKPTSPGDNGPCRVGIISAIGDHFAVQKIGITVFGNNLAEAPIDSWGLDDIVVARVRAVAPGTGVRKIAYAKGAFVPYYDPPTMFRNARDDLTAIVRQAAANANCARYFVVTKVTVKADGNNQTLRGVGVVQQGAGPFTRTNLFAAFQMTVFDGQTYEIHRRPIDFGSILTGSFVREKEPLNEIDNESFPASAAEAAANPMLRDRMRAYLASLLDKMLPAYLKEG